MTTILIILLLGVGYWVYYAGHRSYSYLLIPIVMALVIVQIFEPQIKWLAAKSHPIRVDKVIRRMLSDTFLFYQNLPEPLRESFDKRLWLIIRHKDWTGMKLSSIPEDIKAVAMVPAIAMTMNKEDFLFEKYERVILYKHPFPSPRFHAWHASETNHEEGVIIFSIEQLFNAFLHPDKYYNVAFHEWSAIYIRTFDDDTFSGMKWLNWEELEQIAPYGKEHIEAWLGLPVEDLRQVTLHHYFIFPRQMQKVTPDVFDFLERVFKPVNKTGVLSI